MRGDYVNRETKGGGHLERSGLNGRWLGGDKQEGYTRSGETVADDGQSGSGVITNASATNLQRHHETKELRSRDG